MHKKVKKDLRDEKARARREVPDRRSEYGYADREERRARYREGGRDGGSGTVSTGGGYATYEKVYERTGSSQAGSRERGSSREREREESGIGTARSSGRSRTSSRERGRDDLTAQREASRRDSRYYPPAPQRYLLESSNPRPDHAGRALTGVSSAGSIRSRRSSSRRSSTHPETQPSKAPEAARRAG